MTNRVCCRRAAHAFCARFLSLPSGNWRAESSYLCLCVCVSQIQIHNTQMHVCVCMCVCACTTLQIALHALLGCDACGSFIRFVDAAAAVNVDCDVAVGAGVDAIWKLERVKQFCHQLASTHCPTHTHTLTHASTLHIISISIPLYLCSSFSRSDLYDTSCCT